MLSGHVGIFPGVGGKLQRRTITQMRNISEGRTNPSFISHRTSCPDQAAIRGKVEACTGSLRPTSSARP
jgi:hypothetical protein